MRLDNPSRIARQFFEDALDRRGVKLGPDERTECDVKVQVAGVGESFVIDAWWMKGYGLYAPYRHVKRRIYERELSSRERIYDVFFQACQEIVHELFPMLPRNGRWRLFSRRPRCRA